MKTVCPGNWTNDLNGDGQLSWSFQQLPDRLGQQDIGQSSTNNIKSQRRRSCFSWSSGHPIKIPIESEIKFLCILYSLVMF